MSQRRRPHADQFVNGLLNDLAAAARTDGAAPIYRRLADAIARRVTESALSAGTRLPPERQLAAALGVSRATVVTAYRELETRGVLRGYVGRGTFVAAQTDGTTPFAWRGKISAAALQTTDGTMRELVSHAATPGVVSVAAGGPALDLFPVDAFRAAVDHVLSRPGMTVWGHAPTEGHASVRETFAHRFGGRPDETIVIGGAQQGLDLLARCLIDRGDTVVVDRPGYLGALHSFRSAGARIVGWDVRRADVDELEDLLLRYRPKLLYTNPTFQNPSGVTLPIRTRRELLQLAHRYRLPIVEDETYRELSFGGKVPPSLYELDQQGEVVIRVNSFSKVLAPGLRLGWISAARAIVDQLALMKQQIDPHTNNLAQLAVARLIDNGVFDRHLVQLRQEHRRRRDAMVKTLQQHAASGALRFSVPDGGLFLWCRLAANTSAAAVQRHALKENVFLVTGEPFYADGAGTQELRLCFSVNPVEASVRAATVIARSVTAAARQPARALVSRIV